LEHVDAIAERLERRRRRQDRLDVEASHLDQAPDDEPALGDEEPVIAKPGGIPDFGVVGDARIVEVVERLDHPSSRTTERRLRCRSMTCWPRRLLRNTFGSPVS